MDVMGKQRVKKFLHPDRYELREDKPKQALDPAEARKWQQLADFLGIDTSMDEDAMKEATYYTCLKVLREAIGRMPLVLTRTTERGGVENATDHVWYDTLTLRPNRYTTSTLFWAEMEQARQHYGNAYALKTGSGRPNDPYELWYMPPDEVTVWWDQTRPVDELSDIYYIWTTGGRMRVYKSSEVLHVRSSDTIDGIVGIPLIERLDSLVVGTLRSQKFQGDLVANGMTGKAVLQYAGEVNGKSEQVFKKHIEAYIGGEFAEEGKSNVIPIPVGASLTPLNIKLTDAQFEQLKKYSCIQIAAAFGIKPQQIGDMTKTSYASSQAQNEAFYTDTLLFISKSYEEEVAFKCLTREDRESGIAASFDTSTTLKASFETEVKTLDVAVKGSLMQPDEARARLKLPTVDGGDVLYANGNIIPLTMAGTQWTRDGGGDEQESGQTEGGEQE